MAEGWSHSIARSGSVRPPTEMRASTPATSLDTTSASTPLGTRKVSQSSCEKRPSSSPASSVRHAVDGSVANSAPADSRNNV